MIFDWTIKITDLAIIFAAVTGPILAVQAQKWLERRGASEARQSVIFRTLMATRASNLSLAHVEALNAVPIEFCGVKDVVEAWKLYLDHMGNDTVAATWNETRITLAVGMLHAMAIHLGYSFNKVEIKNEVYLPRKHGDIETDQDIIRRGLALLLSGQVALPMDIKSFPTNEATTKEQDELRKGLLKLLDGQTALAVQIDSKISV